MFALRTSVTPSNKKENLMNINPKITQFAARSLFQLQKQSPIILASVGVVGVVTAGVLAARATLKLEETLDAGETRLDVERAKGAEGNTKKAVILNALDLVKLYGPSVTLGAASLTCIISAQGILHKRNATLALAYKGLEKAYSNYRARVIEEFGEEKDREIRLGVREETVEDDKGKKTKVKTLSTNQADLGEFNFLFESTNPNWTPYQDRNEYFIRAQINYLNDLLIARGHVFLNEVLDRLGIDQTPTGALTGWIYVEKGAPGYEEHEGDNYIDARLFNLDNVHTREFEQVDKATHLLDFNVDGLIWDKIGKK